MLVVVVHVKCTAQFCRVECEMSGRGNWWVRSMKRQTAHARQPSARTGQQLRGERENRGLADFRI